MTFNVPFNSRRSMIPWFEAGRQNYESETPLGDLLEMVSLTSFHLEMVSPLSHKGAVFLQQGNCWVLWLMFWNVFSCRSGWVGMSWDLSGWESNLILGKWNLNICIWSHQPGLSLQSRVFRIWSFWLFFRTLLQDEVKLTLKGSHCA